MKQIIASLIMGLIFLVTTGRMGVALEVDSRVETTYYLRQDLTYNEQILSKTPRTYVEGEHIYITKYIYPYPAYPADLSVTSWQTILEEDISGTVYGYDILIRSDSATRIKLEWILERGSSKVVLAEEYIDNPATSHDTAVHWYKKIKGIDPVSGEGDILTFKITHISGTARVGIYFDGAPLYLGCTYITIPKYPGETIIYNYPNPAKGVNETIFRYYLLYDSDITIDIYDLNYDKIATLFDKGIREKYREINWDITKIASGVYIYVFKTSKDTLVKKLMVIK